MTTTNITGLLQADLMPRDPNMDLLKVQLRKASKKASKKATTNPTAAREIVLWDLCGCGDQRCKFDTFEPISDEDARWEHPQDVYVIDGVSGCYVETCTSSEGA